MNCDPTYELEERIVESSPLHRHHQRRHIQRPGDEQIEEIINELTNSFKNYNRFRCESLNENHVVPKVSCSILDLNQ